jgi:hypothetical protein
MEGIVIHEESTMLFGDITFQTASTPIIAIDTSLYSLSSEQAAFFKAQTGIDDDEELKRHILEMQAKAYEASHFWWTSY